jgi:Na+-translocating ferredoxin:NAD+ oxidoreductase RnfC subunit
MPRPASQVADELAACIGCTECMTVCPALPTPIPIEALNRQTLDGPISPQVMRFAQSCYQCGACVPVCPVGLHRDSMMMWLKIRLLSGVATSRAEDPAEDYYGEPFTQRSVQLARRTRSPYLRPRTARGWYQDEDDEEPY